MEFRVFPIHTHPNRPYRPFLRVLDPQETRPARPKHLEERAALRLRPLMGNLPAPLLPQDRHSPRNSSARSL